MKDRSAKVIGAAIAAGLLLNGVVGLVGLFRPTEAKAAGPQAVYLCDQRGRPLILEEANKYDSHAPPVPILRVLTSPH